MNKPKTSRRRLNFNDHQKDFIVQNVEGKYMSITDLANHFGCHPKTIYRVLEEKGVITPSSKVTVGQQMKKLLEQHNITVEQLEARLAMPLLTPDNVQKFLNRCSKQELAGYFYASGLVKLAELHQRHQQVAALLKPMASNAEAQLELQETATSAAIPA